MVRRLLEEDEGGGMQTKPRREEAGDWRTSDVEDGGMTRRRMRHAKVVSHNLAADEVLETQTASDWLDEFA
jgi:hypothetical protein